MGRIGGCGERKGRIWGVLKGIKSMSLIIWLQGNHRSQVSGGRVIHGLTPQRRDSVHAV